MGSYDFYDEVNETDLQMAFRSAREEAAYQHGHGGYTGTIAEKSEVVIVNDTLWSHEGAMREAERLISEGDPRIDDKWGPAGAMRLHDENGKHNGWLFFGWASS